MKLRLLPLLLSLAACSTPGEAKVALNLPKIDTLAGGVVHLVNTGPTAWRDTSGWRWVPTATVNPAEGSTGELGEISTLAIADDGTVFALQKKPATIKVYGPDGAFLRDIGKEGDGPGEIRDGYLGIRGDTLLLQDPGHSRLTLFLTNGTFLKTVPSPCCYFWPRLTVDSLGRAWVPGSSQGEKASWYRYRMDGSSVDTVEMPPQLDYKNSKNWEVSIKRGSNSMSMIMSAPMQPGTSFEPRIDGMILSGNSDAYRFALMKNGKDTVRIFEASAPILPISAAMRDTLFNNATTHPDADIQKALRASAKKEYIPDNWLPWTHMSLDREGRLWVALPSANAEVGKLQVFDRDGKLLGDVPAPNRKMFKNSAWGGDRLAVLDEDADGRPLIKSFRLQTTLPK
ncbi:MAG: hypothetical protein ABIZ70_01530 [Gemmatimonadales bacterium]